MHRLNARTLRSSLVAGLGLSLSLSLGCPQREVSKLDPTPAGQPVTDIPVEVNRDIDLLFVIDNSGSMGEEQTSLSNNFQRFVNVLSNIQGGLPNVHLGVVSSNAGVGPYTITACGGDGDNGRLQNAPRGSCSGPSGYFVSDIQMPGTMERTKNYTGDLAETFACIAKLGTTGCGLEQHLESMKRALDGSNPENASFLRDSAFLGIILVADEDDCSAADTGVFDPSQTNVSDPLGPLSSFRCTEFGIQCDGNPIGRSPASYETCEPRQDSYIRHPQDYVDFVKGLKADPNLIVVAGITGNPTPFGVGLDMDSKPELLPSCETSAGKAAPAVRLKYFLDQFPGRSTWVSICNDDLSDALIQVAELLRRVIGNPCVEGNVWDGALMDSFGNPVIDCQVSDVRYPNTDHASEETMRGCEMAGSAMPAAPTDANRPCWWVKVDDTNCTKDPHLSLMIERQGDPPTGTHVIARCATK